MRRLLNNFNECIGKTIQRTVETENEYSEAVIAIFFTDGTCFVFQATYGDEETTIEKVRDLTISMKEDLEFYAEKS